MLGMMAPLPNQTISSIQEQELEGGTTAQEPKFVEVPNDVNMCFRPPCWCINAKKEFRSLTNIKCEIEGCTNEALASCNGDLKYWGCGPRLHAGC